MYVVEPIENKYIHNQLSKYKNRTDRIKKIISKIYTYIIAIFKCKKNFFSDFRFYIKMFKYKDLIDRIRKIISKIYTYIIAIFKRQKTIFSYFYLYVFISVIICACIYSKENISYKEHIYRAGEMGVKFLADNAVIHMIEMNIPALSHIISEAQNIYPEISFALYTDNKYTPIVHTYHNPISKLFFKLFNKATQIRNNVRISEGIVDYNPIILFSTYVMFGKEKAGQVHVAIYSNILKNMKSRQKTIFIYNIFKSIAFFLIITILFNFINNRINLLYRSEYQKIKKIDEGGIAEIFLAKYVVKNVMSRLVVLKVLKTTYANNENFIKILHHEAKLAASLYHENIVQIYDFDFYKKQIAMEYIHGVNLKDVLKNFEQGMPENQAIYILLSICDGLRYAHEKNVIHLDIKPQNILISFQGQVKIVDFGIAKSMSDHRQNSSEHISGTLNYMAPEQITGKGGDQRTDIYSLGIVAWEMLTGKRLNQFNNIAEAKQNILKDNRFIIKSSISEKFSNIISKCLQNDMKLRYNSMNDLYDSFHELKNNYEPYDRFQMAHYMGKI